MAAVTKAYKMNFSAVKNVLNVMKANKKIHFIVINAGNATLGKRKTIIIAKNVIFVLKDFNKIKSCHIFHVNNVKMFT